MTAPRVLLTGAASLAGAEVLRALGQRGVASIQLLMTTDETIRNQQLHALESYLVAEMPPVSVVVADLHLPMFGLPLKAWEELAASFDAGIHCFERDTLDDDLERARRANVLPAANWIHLLGSNPALRLHHLSTAFIGGTRRGLLTEFDLDCGQGFHNAYERSKFEAEVRLRESRVSDRVAIYRPSHLLGRSDTGAAFQFSGSYPLLASLAARRVLPGDGRAHIDFIPADYVAAAVVAAVLQNAAGTFHLGCGWFDSLTVKKAAIIASGRNALLLPRAVSWPLRAALPGRAFTSARDLLNQGPVFDTYLADRLLEPLGIARPKPESWLAIALQAARAKQWRASSPSVELPAVEAKPQARLEILRARDTALLGERKFHQVGDVNVAYRDFGQGEPVVFMHGFAGAHSWDGVAERIVAKRRVIIVETLGISESTAPASADFGLPAQAARARGLLSALDIPSAHIVGNDTGGVIAQFFAVRWPQMVRSLTLSDCDAHGVWPPRQIALIAKLMGVPGGTWAITTAMKIPAVARTPLGLGDMVYDRSLLTNERLAGYLHTVAGNSQRRMQLRRFFRSFRRDDLDDMNSFLGQLHVPTMVVWGGDNAYWSPSYARELYDAIPGARRLEIIPFAGISCHYERPDVFAKALGEFLDDVGSSPK